MMKELSLSNMADTTCRMTTPAVLWTLVSRDRYILKQISRIWCKGRGGEGRRREGRGGREGGGRLEEEGGGKEGRRRKVGGGGGRGRGGEGREGGGR